MTVTARTDEPAEGLRQRAKRQRAERILDAALSLLRESPDDTLTMERVATRADVAPMTVVNLIGNREQLFSAVADRAMVELDLDAIAVTDPRARARGVVDAVVRLLRSDPAVFRKLLSGWGGSDRALAHDPTRALIDCLERAADAGALKPGVDPRRYGEVMAAGLLGTIQQWTSGMISDRAFGMRARAVVDVVFEAASA